jgi:rubrerythrin
MRCAPTTNPYWLVPNGRSRRASIPQLKELLLQSLEQEYGGVRIYQAAAQKLKAADAQVLKDAYESLEDQEIEHLYATRGWCRELRLQSLGRYAVLPPSEEVTSALGLSRPRPG